MSNYTQNDWEEWSNFITPIVDKDGCIQMTPKGVYDWWKVKLSNTRREGDKAIQWIVGDDTGTSSKTIWSVMMGVEPFYASVPFDKADYGRCVRLLQFIPEWQSRLGEVVEKYPEWKEAVEHILATLMGEEK